MTRLDLLVTHLVLLCQVESVMTPLDALWQVQESVQVLAVPVLEIMHGGQLLPMHFRVVLVEQLSQAVQ